MFVMYVAGVTTGVRDVSRMLEWSDQFNIERRQNAVGLGQ